jgi:hypothetical protein
MNVMQPCPDDEFEWIRTRREKPRARNTPNWKGNFVSQLMPIRFESYAKILHSIEASYKNIDDPHPLTEREIAVLKIPPCTILKSFVVSLREEGRGPRIRWKTLAQLLGVPFEPEICHEWFRASMEEPICWPRFLSGPDDGNLNAEEFPEVLSILRAFSGNQDSLFRFAEWAFTKRNKPLIFRGVLDELPTFLADKSYRITPEYWWPTDRSWCLCSEFDLKFTIVGGSKNLISAVLNNATLEALEVTPQTRIDDSAPMPC